jgi:hypothetical protein
MATGTTYTVTQVNLAAGDWEICGASYFVGTSSTAYTKVATAVTSTAGSIPTNSNHGATASLPLSITSATPIGQPAGCRRMSLAATTPIYLEANANFTASTVTDGPAIWARRIR